MTLSTFPDFAQLQKFKVVAIETENGITVERIELSARVQGYPHISDRAEWTRL
jgi:hypothetical protein